MWTSFKLTFIIMGFSDKKKLNLLYNFKKFKNKESLIIIHQVTFFTSSFLNSKILRSPFLRYFKNFEGQSFKVYQKNSKKTILTIAQN